MLTDLKKVDKRKGIAAQHIEAMQRQRKITFDKRHKKKALRPGMIVMIQDARKLDFPGKSDAIWMGPYLVREVFPNNFMQFETLNGKSLPIRTAGSKCKEYQV